MSHRDAGVTFDLVPDDDADDETPPAVPVLGPDGEPAVTRLARVDRLRRAVGAALADRLGSAVRAALAFLARQPRRLVAAGVAVALLGGTVAGTTALVRHARASAAERDRVAALLASPGGVRDLSSGPLEVIWSLPVTGDLLAVLPGVIVVADGADVVGVNIDDGSQAWRHELGGDLDCGPWARPGERIRPSTTLVCLAGPAQARRVTVLDAEGSVVAQRALGDTSDLDLDPMPDGGLLAVSRTGQAPALPARAASADQAAALPEAIEAGQGALLTVTDAASGATRWSAEVPFEPVSDPSWCGLVVGVDGSVRVNLEAQVEQVSGLVHLRACGVDGVFHADGTRPQVQLGADGAYLVPDPDGGWAIQAPQSTVLLDDAGAVRFATPQLAAFPQATDSVSPDRLVHDGFGRLLALGPDGAPRWPGSSGGPTPPSVSTTLARADGVVLAVAVDGATLVALDAQDGALLWRHRPPVPLDLGALSVVTDGRAVVLSAVHGTPGPARDSLVGVDLRTGRMWTIERDIADQVRLLAVDGHLIEYAAQDATELRSLPNGETEHRRQGTITLLAPSER